MFRDPSGLEAAKPGMGSPPAGWSPASDFNLNDQGNDVVKEVTKSGGVATGEQPIGAPASSVTSQSSEERVRQFNQERLGDLANARETLTIGEMFGGEKFTGMNGSDHRGSGSIEGNGSGARTGGNGNSPTNNPSNSLPTYQKMYDNYPKDENGDDLKAKKVYKLVGGDVYDLHKKDPEKYANACALRVSIALIKSGIKIPKSKETVTGADGNNYYLSAIALKKWLITYFKDSPPLEISDDFDNQLQGNRGIYIMIPNYPGLIGFGASGHATLFTGTDCISSNCYLNARGGVSRVYLWRLR
jgi:hypothetical protein